MPFFKNLFQRLRCFPLWGFNMDNWTYSHFDKRLDRIEQHLLDIKKQGEKTMAQIDDLNAAITAEDGQVTAMQAVLVKIGADIDALLAKIAAGGTTTDLTAQIQAIQSHVSALTTANAQLVADDTKATS